MNSEQQRELDQAIVAGRLVDAIVLYRTATGCAVPEARAYVDARNAEMMGRTRPAVDPAPFASTSSSSTPFAGISSSSPAFPVESLVKWIGLFVGLVVIFAVAVPLLVVGFTVSRALHAAGPVNFAHGFASFATIVREPYYHDVTREIRKDRGFRGALGTPIAIDDSGVTCAYIHDDAVQHKANCDIPARGPKAAGTVRVQIVDQASTLDLGAWLKVGDRTVPINAYQN